MIKPRFSCFYYKRYCNVYVSGVNFLSNNWLSVLDIFPEQNLVALFETDSETSSILSLLKEGGTVYKSFNPLSSTVTIMCEKTVLYGLINQINITNIDGLFITAPNNYVPIDKFLCSLEDMANSVVKKGNADISAFIDFPENEIEISLARTKRTMATIKEMLKNL